MFLCKGCKTQKIQIKAVIEFENCSLGIFDKKLQISDVGNGKTLKIKLFCNACQKELKKEDVQYVCMHCGEVIKDLNVDGIVYSNMILCKSHQVSGGADRDVDFSILD